MAFRWRADDGPLIVTLPPLIKKNNNKKQTKKKRYQSWTPSDKTFSIHACPSLSLCKIGNSDCDQLQSYLSHSSVYHIFECHCENQKGMGF